MKDLVEFAKAVMDVNSIIQEDHGEGDTYDWKDFDMNSYNITYVMELIEDEKLRIKPNKTYFRVELNVINEWGNPVTHKSDKPFPDSVIDVHDFEIEQPVPDNETITLYEHKDNYGGSMWLTSP